MASNDSCDSLMAKLSQLPKKPFWELIDLYQWEGFWYLPQEIERVISFQSQFEARDDDVFLTSSMKTGTTWLKALCASIMLPQGEGQEEDILAQNNPHIYAPNMYDSNFDPSVYPSPRLLSTHVPYSLLPHSIKKKECKIVYITRSPKDTLVSFWHFANGILRPNQEPYPLEKAFESFCDGVLPYGPFFDHLLEYWKASLEMPDKVLFLKFEDLKRDPKEQVKKLASFLGKPFENEDQVDKVLWRCSLKRLKNLEVNQTGGAEWVKDMRIPFSSFFREGNVGDWKNHFTPEMGERLDQIARAKLEGSGLEIEI